NATSFDGYTDGRGKERIDGLLSTGDIGHIDDAGRLFIDGREDDMMVSEGELKQLVRTKLAPFKVPREIEFVTDLPLNEAGKVVKADLGVSRRGEAGPAAPRG